MLHQWRQILKGRALLSSSTAVNQLVCSTESAGCHGTAVYIPIMSLAVMRAVGSRQALQQHICQTLETIRTYSSSSVPATQEQQSEGVELTSNVSSSNQQAPEQSQQELGTSSQLRPLAAAYGPRKVAAKSKVAEVQKREGIVHVNSTMNNTIMVLTDREHKVQTWTSGGTIGYKNANKATPMAAELAGKELAKRAVNMGFHSVVVKLKGMGKNKQFAVQSLAANGLTVTQLWDVTPIPYNGCRLPRRRRV